MTGRIGVVAVATVDEVDPDAIGLDVSLAADGSAEREIRFPVALFDDSLSRDESGPCRPGTTRETPIPVLAEYR